MTHKIILCGLFIAWTLGGGCSQSGQAQAVTLKFFALSYHLKPATNPEIFRNRLDARGTAVANYGYIAGYDHYFRKRVWSIRVEQGLYADCTASLAGFWHLGWRAKFFDRGRHSLNGGIGPTLVFRRDWNRIPGYTDDFYFSQAKGWQYRFFLYAGELEYNYALDSQTAVSLTLIPGLPELFSLGIGFRRHF